MIKDNSHRFLFSSATYSNRSNAGFPTKAFHPQREGWSPKKWANYRNRPLLPCFYTHPLFLSFSLLCASVSSIHQARYSFRGDRHSSSNFLQLRIREQVSDRRRISLRSGKNYCRDPRLPRVCHVRDENLLDYFQSIRNASNTGFRSPGYRFCTASPRSASAEGRDEGWRQDATPSLSRDPITDLLFALYSSLNEN